MAEHALVGKFITALRKEEEAKALKGDLGNRITSIDKAFPSMIAAGEGGDEDALEGTAKLNHMHTYLSASMEAEEAMNSINRWYYWDGGELQMRTENEVIEGGTFDYATMQ